MGSLSAVGLLHLPVRLHGITLGRPVDVLLDAGGRRVLGFVVESGHDAPRFLPFAASQPGTHAIEVGSALMLLDDVSFYRTRGTSLRSLLGTEVERRGGHLGSLIDLHVDRAGDVVELEVEAAGGLRRRVGDDGSAYASSAATAA